MRIISSHIRDLQRFASLTFLRAPFNLADVGTKFAIDINACGMFAKSGRFDLGFTSGKECKSVSQSEK